MENNVTINTDKLKEAALKFPDAEQALIELFPDVFNTPERVAIKAIARFINEDDNVPYSWFQAMPGNGSEQKAQLLFENYIKPNLQP